MGEGRTRTTGKCEDRGLSSSDHPEECANAENKHVIKQVIEMQG